MRTEPLSGAAHQVSNVLYTLLLGTPQDNSPWATFVIWTARIVTLALLLRTYIVPSIIRMLSTRVRVRSISFRSIRGLYLHAGKTIWNVERIKLGWRWVSKEKTIRMTVLVEGLKVEIVRRARRPKPPPRRRHARMPTLADLSPFPIVWYAWLFTTTIYSFTRRLLQPVTTKLVVLTFRTIILTLPTLTQIMEFELDTATLHWPEMADSCFAVHKAALASQIAFSQAGIPEAAIELPAVERGLRLGTHLVRRIAYLLQFLMGSSRERAWASTQCCARISLQLDEIVGFTAGSGPGSGSHFTTDTGGIPKDVFLALPQGIKLSTSAQFYPATMTPDPGTFVVSLDLGQIHLGYDMITPLVQAYQAMKSRDAKPVDPEDMLSGSESEIASPLLSPGVASPSKSSTISPRLRSIEALSAFRWRQKHALLQRARRRKSPPWLLYLGQVDVQSSRLSLSSSEPFPLRASMGGLSLGCRLSHPEDNALHREWVGGRPTVDTDFHAGVYAFKLSSQETSLERTNTRGACMISLGALNISGITSNWPIRWQKGTSFMRGDPNAALLIVQASLAHVRLADRLELLQFLLNRVSKESKEPSVPSSFPFWKHASPTPRVKIDFHVGELRGSLLCPDPRDGRRDFVVETHSAGLTLSASTSLTSIVPKVHAMNLSKLPSAQIPLQMDFDLNCHMESASIIVIPNVSDGTLPGSQRVDQEREPFLLVDPLELSASGRILCSASDDDSSVVTIDASTTTIDVLCVTDAVSVELWHPEVVAALTMLMALPPKPQKPQAMNLTIRPLDRLPFGTSGKIGVRRLTIFVTSPDIAPSDDMELSRGVGMRTSLSATYCAIRENDVRMSPPSSARAQMRQKLSLPEERMMQAAAAARTASVTNQEAVFVQVALRDFVLRAAVATRFAADDPYCEELDDVAYQTPECITIPEITADITFRGQRVYTGVPDICGVNVTVPLVRATLHLADVYSLLLSSQCLNHLFTSRLTPAPKSSKALPPSRLSLSASATIENFQVFLNLPLKQHIYLRANAIGVRKPSSGAVTLHADELYCFVPQESGAAWAELVRLQAWTVSLPQAPNGPITVKVDGGARLRIPNTYIFNDLVRSIGVTVKCLRHLTHVVKSGKYFPMGDPEAEGPKNVPTVQLHLRILTFEAEDDPFESQLALLWRTGLAAAIVRGERDDAFQVKAAKIRAAELPQANTPNTPRTEYRFDDRHNVSVNEARDRLLQVHALDWVARHRSAEMERHRREETTQAQLWANMAKHNAHDIPDMVEINPVSHAPPLVRIVARDIHLGLSVPSFPVEAVSDFLLERGGMPRDTQYSLLVPLHLKVSMGSMRLALRDYPLPLVNVPPMADPNHSALYFETDLVVAEEMGTPDSVDWVECIILDPDTGIQGASSLHIQVPKTIMPVKTYASPDVRITTTEVTDLSWGVSYGPAMQDLMRVVETLTSPPQDSSPPVGFWDKMRLQFHWKVQVLFNGEVHLHLKGTRDPHIVVGDGAGFVLCWSGNPQLRIGFENNEKEFAQLHSETMVLAIPDLEVYHGRDAEDVTSHTFGQYPRKFRKVCAKLRSGVQFGIGAVLERACGEECQSCNGTAFLRACRFFDFKPHYTVKLEKKHSPPGYKTPQDSFNAFRSDFIHMSISLTSSLGTGATAGRPSSFHLNHQVFAHFWSWWQLFDRTLSLQIRQGRRWSQSDKLASPKLGQHLATLKYKIAVHRLFISHVYADNSRDAWEEGLTPFVGIKALIDDFHADLHQREEEIIVPATSTRASRTLRSKPFNAAEVVMKGLDLRSMLAIFSEPLKRTVPLESSAHSSNYRTRNDIPAIDHKSPWVDFDDFVEIDSTRPPADTVHIIPAASCPQFTYFKRAKDSTSSKSRQRSESTKFGDEDTHACLLGKEASVSQVQIDMAKSRISELQTKMDRERNRRGGMRVPVNGYGTNMKTTSHDGTTPSPEAKMIALLTDYIAQLRRVETDHYDSSTASRQSYYMPTDSVAPDEWADFDHVYQIHCPKVYLDNTVRDVMMQYYYCSRARRGFEYHMATRAVKFIRDQAEVALATLRTDKHRMRNAVAGAQNAAANALRRMLTVEAGPRVSVLMSDEPTPPSSGSVNPLAGWSDDVSLNKSHFVLLLKPQIVLRSESNSRSVCILAAVQAKSQAFNILDDSNADDPISGRVMTRSYTSVSGLQMFSPSLPTRVGDDCVPLEVLVDLRCESSDFDRLVPQTDATFHYDKFNRLRLRNNVTSVVQASRDNLDSHLQHQTDLIRVHVPQFTVSATDKHFQAISDIVTNLVLYSDAAHKTRSDKLDTLLFSYDFTDLASAAHVVSDLQARLRQVVEAERAAESRLVSLGDHGKAELLTLKAQILSLAEELTLIFDAIKLAQDKVDEHHDHKSALLLRTSSSEISWRMLDDQRDLLAKLAVRDIDYSWLSRQDSSTVNKLQAGDLQAFAGSPRAVWAEILSKHNEPSNHPLLKQGHFLLAKWTLLPPVGGISIYENFELLLHPMRLQVDTRVGGRLMEYVWPERKRRNGNDISEPPPALRTRRITDNASASRPSTPRASLDSPRLPGKSLDGERLAPPNLRRMTTSRSFTDLRSIGKEQSLAPPRLQRNVSFGPHQPIDVSDMSLPKGEEKARNDAEEMKSRSSQKTFVLVRVGSLHLLLSVMKEQSFVCQDARIQTRDLEYRNQTWSFEELVDQFIPSDPSWKGWVKMALHQPLIPVLPVARELFTKTKFARKAGHLFDIHGHPSRHKTPTNGLTPQDDTHSGDAVSGQQALIPSDERDQPFFFPSSGSEVFGSGTTSTNSSDLAAPLRPPSRNKVLRMFTRHAGRKSVDSHESGSSSGHIPSEAPPRLSMGSRSSQSHRR